MPKKFLIKHVGNMGDMLFFVPPVLATLKRRYPGCHITFVTAWGYKDARGRWGKRNQSGFCIALMMTNPHVDQLVHWHDTALSLTGDICQEEDRRFPTWNLAYWDQQKNSDNYDGVYELDFGIGITDNPLTRMYEAVGLPDENYTNYQIHLTDHDRQVAQEVTTAWPTPRIVLLEGLEGKTTRGWDPAKLPILETLIRETYGVAAKWFGGKFVQEWEGRPLTLRENIATLLYCDVAIGVMSGPLHFAAAVGLPTITLFCDQPLHRAAPAYFLNTYISEPSKRHRTLLGPDNDHFDFLKNDAPARNLTPAEAATQGGQNWQQPGRQSTKTCLAVLTPEEVMTVLQDVLPVTSND